MIGNRRFIASVAVAAIVSLVGTPAHLVDAQRDGPTLGIAVHTLDDPFIDQLLAGAQAAADDLGVTLVVAGPAEGSGNPQLQAIEGLLADGVDGIATTMPADSMSSVMNDIVDTGIPVVQFSLYQSKLVAPYVGNRTRDSGRRLGTAIVDALGGEEASGTVIVGNCYPRYSVLEARGAGVLESLDVAAVPGLGAGLAPPGLRIVGPIDTTYEPATNYAAWEAALVANPDARALIALCGSDLPNLVKLKQAHPTTQFIIGGYDLTEATYAGLQDGSIYATVDQNPFLQGYLPIQILTDILKGNLSVNLEAGGFVDSGTEVVTQAGVSGDFGLPELSLDDRHAMIADAAVAQRHYRSAIEGYVHDWQTHVEPAGAEAR